MEEVEEKAEGEEVEGGWLGPRKVGGYSWLRIHERPNLVLAEQQATAATTLQLQLDNRQHYNTLLHS